MTGFFNLSWHPPQPLDEPHAVFQAHIASLTEAELAQLNTEAGPLYLALCDVVQTFTGLTAAHQAWAVNAVFSLIHHLAVEDSCDA